MSAQLIIPRRTLIFTTLILILIFAAGLAYLYLPSAVVEVVPATSERIIEHDIVISVQAQEPDFVHSVLPAKKVTGQAEVRQDFTRQGVTTHDDYARGQVTVINNRDEQQSLLPKTHLRHEATGVFFLTDSPLTIPAQNQAKVSVTAKEKGAGGNVPAGRFIIDKLPVQLQSDVFATSSQDFTGGTAVDSPLSEAELAEAKAQVLTAARQQASGQLTGEAGGAGINDSLVSFEVVSEDSSAAVGSQTSSFTITTRVRARALVVDDKDLLSLTLLALRNSPGPDEEFVSYRPESFRTSIIAADFDRGEAKVKGTLTGVFAAKIGPAVLNSQNLAGLAASEVIEHFKQFPSVSGVTVSFWPFWVRTVPGRAGAVKIIIKGSTDNN